jgi:hypothetical protein
MDASEPGGGRNPQRGATEGAANPRFEERIDSVEQSLVAEAVIRGSRLAGERVDDNGMEATPGDEPGRLRIGRNPWTEKEPWTWLRDETSPQSRKRSKPSRG